MSKPRRSERLQPTCAPLTPKYPSRVESLAASKQTFHQMRRILGRQHDQLTALQRDLSELTKVVRLLQNIEIPKPKEAK